MSQIKVRPELTISNVWAFLGREEKIDDKTAGKIAEEFWMSLEMAQEVVKRYRAEQNQSDEFTYEEFVQGL